MGRQQQQEVIVNKTTTINGKEPDLIQSRNIKNMLTAETETGVQRKIDSKPGKVNLDGVSMKK